MPPLAEQPDPDFERRWTQWRQRGVAHERKARQQFPALAVVVAALIFIALATRSFISS